MNNKKEQESEKRYARYVVLDTPLLNRFKPMQSYVSFFKDSDIFYLGMNHLDRYEKDQLEELVKEGKLIKLPKPVNLGSINELFLTPDKKIVSAISWNPLKKYKVIHSL